MATAREVVKAALRKINAVAASEEPSTSDMADGLEALNDLMESFVVDGVTLAHQTLTLTDEVNLDPAHIRTIKNQLAVEIAPEFGAAVDPQVAFAANEGLKMLRADTRIRRTVSVDKALLRGNRW